MNYFQIKHIFGDIYSDKSGKIIPAPKEFEVEFNPEVYNKASTYYKNQKLFKKFRDINLELTKKSIKNSISDDQLIVQCTSMIEDLNLTLAKLAHRLRDWYSLYNPETENSIEDHEAFIRVILEKDRASLIKGVSMGADFDKKDLAELMEMAKEIIALYRVKSKKEKYQESLMKRHCPNLLAVAGSSIGAKLLEHTGSLKKLALMPASTIQLLGAEKALFQHLKKHTKPPKHGYIIMHPCVASAKNKGKKARTLADKISIACRVDYFKGEFIGDKLRAEVEE